MPRRRQFLQINAALTKKSRCFESHIQQFYDTLEAGGAVGRRLDFLVQEMNREVNTMGSKASDITITNQVIALKSEIEKLREHIQNLE